MAITYQSILESALRVANLVGMDANSSAWIDNKIVLEDLFYSACRQAILDGSDNPNEIGDLKYDHTVTITNGVGTLPSEVLDELLSGSTVYSDDGALNGLMSFQPRYFDYIRDGHTQLGYYAIQDNNLLLKEPGGEIGTYDGDVHLVTTSMPTIVDATTTLNLSKETAKRTVEILAQMLRGVKK